jgi:hypothetical protein
MDEKKEPFWKHIDTTEEHGVTTVTSAANVPNGILVSVTVASFIKETQEEEIEDSVQLSQNVVLVTGACVKEVAEGYVIGKL